MIRRLASALLFGLASTGPGLAQTGTAPPAQPALKPAVVATLLNNKGDKIGTATLTGGEHRTVIRLQVDANGLPPGWHGAHFHAVADCSDVEKFENSKAHVNHTAKKHGLLNAEGPDEGDIPNVYAAGDGSVNAELSTTTLLDGKEGLRDADGSALILHASADDHTSQPIGGAGARLACAVIK